MLHHAIQITIFYSFISMFSSCAPADSVPANPEKAQAILQKETTPIRYAPTKTVTFYLKTFSTGTLAATAHAEIKTTQSGQLKSLPIKEGTFVKKGDLLARLDATTTKLRLEKAQLALEEAEFNKNDLLVMQGGTWGVDTSVNEATLMSIHQQSGYKKALHAIKELDYELGQTKIPAPFDGIVADVEVNAHQYVGAGEAICTLIDPLSFEAVFSLLEKEAVQVKTGQAVKLSPMARPGQALRGKVSSINPVVDEHGLVRIHAAINPGDLRRNRLQNRLFDGMNVRVALEKAIPGQLVVPKAAVVLRSGKPVVFTYDVAAGLAKWNYVTIAYENDKEVAIGEGLKEGDLVIYEGNLNLDHDAEVMAQPMGDFFQKAGGGR